MGPEHTHEGKPEKKKFPDFDSIGTRVALYSVRSCIPGDSEVVVIEPVGPEAFVPEPAPDSALVPPGERLRAFRLISVVLMGLGGSALVVVFFLWLGVLWKKVPEFHYEYFGIGSFLLYFLGRLIGFIRRMIVKPDKET